MKIVQLLILICSICVCTEAKTVHLSEHATPNDGIDDSVGFQACIDDLKAAGGGTLIVDDGTWILSRMINMQTFGNYISYSIKGDKGAVLQFSADETTIGFNIGNANQAEFEDLIFIGKPEVLYDVQNLILSFYTGRLVIDGCQFYGLRAKESLIYVGNVDAVIENTDFEGSGAAKAIIYGSPSIGGISIKGVRFVDYGNFRNVYYAKTGAMSWITVENSRDRSVQFYSPNLTVDRTRFDEGALVAIKVQNLDDVTVTNCAFNVSAIIGGAGVLLDNVGHAVIQNSSFGYSPERRPALKLLNSSTAQIARLRFGNLVYFADIDASSEARISYCPACREGEDPPEDQDKLQSLQNNF